MIYIAHASHSDHIDVTLMDVHDTERKYVFGRYESPSNDPATCMAKAREVLADFDFTRDYYTSVGGDALANAMCMIALADAAYEQEVPAFNWLRYERQRDARNGKPEIPERYTPVHVRF